MNSVKENQLTDKQIEQQVREVVYENMIEGTNGGYTYHYTKPSPGTYPFQYFWDTCFHVYTLTALGDFDMAKRHIRSLFQLQEPDGFVGHILYWEHPFPHRITDLFQLRPKSLLKLTKPHMTALIQPPLVAEAVQRIYNSTKDVEFLKEMLPKLKSYYDWLRLNRDFEGKGLLSIISPYESGIDWKASFDPVLNFEKGKADWRLFLKVMWLEMGNFRRGYDLNKIYQADNFIVKDSGMNTLYAQNLYAMADLCRVLVDSDADTYTQLANLCSQSILEYMYNPEENAFFDLAGHDLRQLKTKTATIFLPTVLPNIPDEICRKVIERHLLNVDGFQVPYPIPSLSINEPAFNPNESIYIWRGPTWIVFNWFLHRYLLRKGYREITDRLLDAVRKLITKSGFREYYNPFTGEGHGAQQFTWSGLVLDMLQENEVYEKQKAK